MSLIERALQKARVARVGTSSDVPGAFAPAAPPPLTEPIVPTLEETIAQPAGFPRVAAEPQLVLTDAFLREKALKAPAEQEPQQRAEYRHIKHGLLPELRDPEVKRVILVTSALQGEGKSFSAAHLALSLALEPDYTVVLVDADVVRPNLSRTFGLLDRPGFMDAIADPTIDPQSLIVTTNIEGLSLIPAGRPHENATEYFASNRIQEVVDGLLSVPNRIVVVDSFPLLQTTEARALSGIAGQILFVVRAESTPQSAVQHAIELLGEGANLKLLLNAVVRNKALTYLGGEYGMGYGYDYHTEK